MEAGAAESTMILASMVMQMMRDMEERSRRQLDIVLQAQRQQGEKMEQMGALFALNKASGQQQ